MANIVITTSGSIVTVEYNDYASTVGFSKHVLHKEDMSLALVANSSYIEVTLDKWIIAINTDGTGNYYIVDSINGIAPIDNSDLLTKLKAIM